MRKFLLFITVFLSVLNSDAQVSQDFFVKVDTVSDLNASLGMLQSELKKYPTLDDVNRLRFFERIGKKYIQMLKVDSAFIYLNDGLLIAEKARIDSSLARFHHIKGGGYYYISQSDEALKEFELSSSISRRTGNKKQLAATLSNIGAIYVDRKDTPKALLHLNESISLHREIGLENSPNNILANRILGTLYFNNGEIEKAKNIFTDLVRISKEVKSPDTQISAQTYLARCFGKLGRKSDAIRTFEEIILVAQAIQNKDSEAAVLHNYSGYMAEIGDYQKALELNKQGWLIRKAVFDAQLASAVSDAEVKYKTEIANNEKTIAQLEVKQKDSELILSAEKQKQQWWIIIVLAVVFVFAIIVAVVFIRLKKLKTQKELESARVNAVLSGQERERERIAKDLHDGIVQDLAAVKHRLQLNADSLNQREVAQEVIDDVTRAATEVRNISYQLMPLSLKEFGLKVSIEALFERTSLVHQIACECTFIGMDERLSEQMEVTIYRVCQELIQNAVKHSKTKTLHALFKRNDQNIQINFEDDGIGFDEKLVKEGIGLNSIRSRVEMVGGTIEKEFAQENTGTVFYIKLPI
jgi:signal transduction histidine kinase